MNILIYTRLSIYRYKHLNMNHLSIISLFNLYFKITHLIQRILIHLIVQRGLIRVIQIIEHFNILMIFLFN